MGTDVSTPFDNSEVTVPEDLKGCKDQESIQSSTTPDPGYQWESDKLTEEIYYLYTCKDCLHEG